MTVVEGTRGRGARPPADKALKCPTAEDGAEIGEGGGPCEPRGPHVAFKTGRRGWGSGRVVVDAPFFEALGVWAPKSA